MCVYVCARGIDREKNILESKKEDQKKKKKSKKKHL